MSKTKCLFIALVVAFLGVYANSIALSAADQRDGNWWRQQGYGVQLAYVTGFFDGMELGKNFSCWNFINDPSKKRCLEAVINSFYEYLHKYFSNITNDQIVDGLNAFYEDFRNRKIRLDNGVWIVVNEIAGKSEKEMKKMIENWRRNAP